MEKDTLRMQMLAGVITEGEYKAKLEENKFFNFFKKKEDSNINALKQERDKLINDVNNDENLSDEEKAKNIKGIKDAFMAQVRQYDMLEEKDSLNEHFVAGGIVGIGAINQIPSRTKEVYEDAFEYFLKERYETKFENREQDLNEEEEKEEEDLDEGKEVEEPENY